MSDRSHERLGLAAVVAVAGAALLLGLWSPPVGAQDAGTTQLRLDLQNLRYQYDLRFRQMEGTIDRLTERIRYLETARVGDALARQSASPPERPETIPVEPEPGRGAELRARRFVVEDEAGRVRAVLGMTEAHGPMLALLGADGQIGALYRIEPPSER